MGILAALQLDGAVSFYAVPHPSALHEAASHADGPIYGLSPPPVINLPHS